MVRRILGLPPSRRSFVACAIGGAIRMTVHDVVIA
jgi:hypothetical protein